MIKNRVIVTSSHFIRPNSSSKIIIMLQTFTSDASKHETAQCSGENSRINLCFYLPASKQRDQMILAFHFHLSVWNSLATELCWSYHQESLESVHLFFSLPSVTRLVLVDWTIVTVPGMGASQTRTVNGSAGFLPSLPGTKANHLLSFCELG